MPLKLSRRFKKKLYKRSRKSVKIVRVKRTPKYNGLVRQTRVQNAATVGLNVDGTVLAKVSGGYMSFFHPSAAAGSLGYGSFQYTASLGALPGYSEFATMYEKYRIDKVRLSIIPMATSATTGGAASAATTQASVLFHWVLDYDDAILPTPSEAGLQELRERQGYRTRNILQGGGRPIVVTFKPRITAPVYQTGLVSAYQEKSKQWVDTDYSDVPHWGVKGICESISPGVQQFIFFKVEAKYYLSLKGVQ